MFPGSTALTVMLRGAKLNGRGAYEAKLPRLAGCVMAPAGIAGDGTGDGRSNHDAALAPSLQPGQARLDGEKGPLEVDIHHLVPIGRTYIREGRGWVDSRVATEDVDAAMPFDRGLGHADVVFRLRNVHADGVNDPPAGSDFSGCGLGLGKVP